MYIQTSFSIACVCVSSSSTHAHPRHASVRMCPHADAHSTAPSAHALALHYKRNAVATTMQRNNAPGPGIDDGTDLRVPQIYAENTG